MWNELILVAVHDGCLIRGTSLTILMVLVAEVVAHYCPKLVDVHNYSAANSLAQKVYNWNTLNVKVFRRLHFSLTKDDIEAVASGEPQMIERILKLLKYKMAKYKPSGLSGETFTMQKSDEPFSNAKTRCSGASSLMRLAQQTQSKEENFRQVHSRDSEGRESKARFGTPSNTPVSPDQYPTPRSPSPRRTQDASVEKLQEKDAHIRELGETIELLEAKVRKLEQLVKLKEHKIQVLGGKLTSKGRA